MRAERWAREGPGLPSEPGAASLTSKSTAGLCREAEVELTPERSSAIASIWCADQRPASAFGRLDDFDDLTAAGRAAAAELAELDAALAGTLLVRNLTWRDGRSGSNTWACASR